MLQRIRSLRKRSVTIVVAVLVVAVGGATAAFATTSAGGHAYRTAIVTTGSVASELEGSGTIEPVAEATVAFPIAGTVKSVAVKVGAHVEAGATLATLDATALEQDVIERQAALAAANLKLYQALHGESSSSTRGTGATATATTTAAVTPTRGGGTGSGSTTDAQAGILRAQQQVDVAFAAAQTALADAGNTCSVSTSTPAPTPTRPGGAKGSAPSSTSTSSTSTTVPAAAATTVPATGGLGSAACIASEQRLLTAQQALSSAQQTLAGAEQAYERALSASASSSSASASASTPTNASTPASSNTVSAAQLVADQAAVDAAGTALLASQEAVAQATVTSPIAGTVAAVSLQVGKAVTAASTTATVVVVGAGGYEVATTVGVNDITKVTVGDAARVVPDGTSQTLTGKIVWVGAPTGSASSTTYPVVIGLAASPETPRSGTLASTSIELARAAVTAVTVPTSAVRTTNGVHLVTLLANGKTSTVAVQIGVVGVDATQIVSGLRVGQVVVLADLHAAVPSSNTNTRIANSITGGGAFTGGGLGR